MLNYVAIFQKYTSRRCIGYVYSDQSLEEYDTANSIRSIFIGDLYPLQQLLFDGVPTRTRTQHQNHLIRSTWICCDGPPRDTLTSSELVRHTKITTSAIAPL